MTTYHAEAAIEDNATPRRRWYPDDVRAPQSIYEADAAVYLIDSQIASCDARRSFYERGGADTSRVDGLIIAWKAKRAEMVYAAEVMRAGEPISLDPEAKARIAELTKESDSLRRSAARLAERNEFLEKQQKAYGAMAKGVNPSRVADLQRQNDDLIAKNKRLIEQVETMKASRVSPTPDEVKARLKKSLHDSYAFGLEVIEEMTATGATLTPFARLFVALAVESVPAGYRSAWRAKDLQFKREAAEAMSREEG